MRSNSSTNRMALLHDTTTAKETGKKQRVVDLSCLAVPPVIKLRLVNLARYPDDPPSAGRQGVRWLATTTNPHATPGQPKTRGGGREGGKNALFIGGDLEESCLSVSTFPSSLLDLCSPSPKVTLLSPSSSSW